MEQNGCSWCLTRERSELESDFAGHDDIDPMPCIVDLIGGLLIFGSCSFPCSILGLRDFCDDFARRTQV
jgi:hypothetical protein